MQVYLSIYDLLVERVMYSLVQDENLKMKDKFYYCYI